MEFVQQVLAWLNDAAVKSVLLFVGGFVLSRWPGFVRKAIPMVLAVASAVTAAGHALFPSVAAPVPSDPASFAFVTVAGVQFEAARSAGAQITSWAWNTLAPLAFAIASHSGPKNTREWIAMGCRVFWPARER